MPQTALEVQIPPVEVQIPSMQEAGGIGIHSLSMPGFQGILPARATRCKLGQSDRSSGS